jgi:hypothetical protein
LFYKRLLFKATHNSKRALFCFESKDHDEKEKSYGGTGEYPSRRIKQRSRDWRIGKLKLYAGSHSECG